MSLSRVFISIRWKIILLASFVLALTGSFFIWQQYQLQLRGFDAEQARFYEQNQLIVKQLFLSQADRIQTLAGILIEHDHVRNYILKKEPQKLLQAVDVLSNELSFGQGVSTVVFHDQMQNKLVAWGKSHFDDDVTSVARAAIERELPQSHLSCEQTCQYLMAIPIVEQGDTIGSITLISNLEDLLLNLYHLSNAHVAVLNSYASGNQPFTPETRIRSVSGGKDIARVLEAARNGIWQNGHFQVTQDQHIYQVIGIPVPIKTSERPWLALILDVTQQVHNIRFLMLQSLWWGAGTLLTGILMLYILLQPSMRRIQHVGQVLPLLGEEKFAEVRKRVRTQRLLPDEMDVLETLASTLSSQLEDLKNKSIRYASSLSTQALQLEQERDFIAGLLDTAPVLILSYNKRGDIQLANQYAVESCGANFSSLTGKSFQETFLNQHSTECFEQIIETSLKQTCRSESRLKRSNGTTQDIVWFHSKLTLSKDLDDPIFLSIGMDVSTQKQQAAEIHTLAYYDPLTRLPNRRMLMDRLQYIINTEQQRQNYCALIAIDVDGFKIVNDTKGHNVGNWILTEIAKRLQGCVDEVNTIVRVGSDEFVVLLEELGRDASQAAFQAKLIGENIRDELARPYFWQQQEIHCTGSFGIDLFVGGDTPPEEHLKQAEIALHYAKDAGHNSLRFFDPDMQTMLEARTTLEADLRISLPRNQFRLFYQPQVDITGKPIGAECLLRWIHPQRGLVSPLHFIPLAEETSLILPIGRWVLETACQQIKDWEKNPITSNLELSVNVSAQQFHQNDFVEQVMDVIKTYEINPERLKIELTESTILDNIVETIDKMEALRNHGVRFSMDDFGTGYSSLAYLTQLPLTQLKIDQAFVRNLGLKISDAVIIQTIINMAKSLDMDVIAEGVETTAQCHFLRDAGCLKYQGYLFSKALPIDDFMICISHFVQDCDKTNQH